MLLLRSAVMRAVHLWGARRAPTVFAIVLTAVALPAWAATHYLTLINDDAVSALRVELAPHGTTDWQTVDTAGPLQGGRAGQATVTMPAGVCVVDVRVTYADRGPLTVTEWNACRQPALYLGKARRAGLRHAAPL
jgi:hypothetical protein